MWGIYHLKTGVRTAGPVTKLHCTKIVLIPAYPSAGRALAAAPVSVLHQHICETPALLPTGPACSKQQYLMPLWRKSGPVSCRVFNRLSQWRESQIPGGGAIPRKQMAIRFRLLATWETSSVLKPLHIKPALSAAGYIPRLLQDSERNVQLVSLHVLPYSRIAHSSHCHCFSSTRERFFLWAATQPGPTALCQAKTWAGKLPGLKLCGFNEIFYDLCSKLPVLSIVFE